MRGPGTTAFLLSANGDMGMEGSPSFEGDTQQRAQPSAQGTAAGIRRDLAKAEAKGALEVEFALAVKAGSTPRAPD